VIIYGDMQRTEEKKAGVHSGAFLVSGRSSGLNDLSFEFRHGQETFLQNIHTGSGAHTASHSMGTGVFISSAHSGRDVMLYQFPPRSGEVKNEWSSTSTHTTCPHGAGRDVKYYEYSDTSANE
jgi:hypothetical protein